MSNFICFKAEWLSNDQDRADIITAYLSEFPFTHFENEGQWLKAFADEHDIAENEYEGIEEAVMDYCDRMNGASWSVRIGMKCGRRISLIRCKLDSFMCVLPFIQRHQKVFGRLPLNRG